MPIIKSIEVKNFRAVPNVEIPVAKNITILSGRNATCKTTLLGMLSHPFGSRKTEQRAPSDIWGNPMVSKFGDIFKFSEEFDVVGQHEYVLNLYQETPHGKNVTIRSFKRSESKLGDKIDDEDGTTNDGDIDERTPTHNERSAASATPLRFVVGKQRSAGQGNLNFPVMYLSLKRLFPIGETRRLKLAIPDFTNDEKVWLSGHYKNIMADPFQVSFSVSKSLKEKDSLGLSNSFSDVFTNSAGQDNISRILGTILSFKRLHALKSTNNYNGGILLIDEVDASLHPAGQKTLFDFLYKSSQKYDIQIFVTTHSLEFINEASLKIDQAEHPTRINILYFTRDLSTSSHKITFKQNPCMDFIKKDIRLCLNSSTRIINEKIPIYVEDDQSAWLLKGIVSRNIKGRILIKPLNMDCEKLKNLIIDYVPKIKELKDSFVVLDGDQSSSIPRKYGRILCLPGGKSPERSIFDFLEIKSSNSSDSFWSNPQGYTIEHYCQKCPATEVYKSRSAIKILFIECLNENYWGKNGNWLLRHYKAHFAQEIEAFNKKLKNVLNDYFKNKQMELIV